MSANPSHALPRRGDHRHIAGAAACDGFRLLQRLLLLAVLFMPVVARAELKIQAKAVMTESKEDEEIWVIRISLKNHGSATLGPLVVQYRRSGYSEFEPDGSPTTGKVDHTEGTIAHEISEIPPGQQVTVDSPGMNFVGPGDLRKLAKGMIQNIRVRAWQHGQLVGEFAETHGKVEEAEWPVKPPVVPAGVEAGSGPWLLVEHHGAEFGGLTLGASAAQVMTMLKTQGEARPLASSEPFHGYPFRMTSMDLPGAIFAFDATKKLAAIEISDPARCKLPGGLILGQSRLEAFDAVFGAGNKPVGLAAGAAARQYLLPGWRLTFSASMNGVASTVLLEAAP